MLSLVNKITVSNLNILWALMLASICVIWSILSFIIPMSHVCVLGCCCADWSCVRHVFRYQHLCLSLLMISVDIDVNFIFLWLRLTFFCSCATIWSVVVLTDRIVHRLFAKIRRIRILEGKVVKITLRRKLFWATHKMSIILSIVLLTLAKWLLLYRIIGFILSTVSMFISN